MEHEKPEWKDWDKCGGEHRAGFTREGLDAVFEERDRLRAINAALLAACKRLLGCPDLNLDELSPETLKAIDNGNDAVRHAEGMKFSAYSDPNVFGGTLP